jgi:TonB family protein
MAPGPQPNPRNRHRSVGLVALGVSAGVHVLFALGTLRLPTPRTPSENRTAIEVSFQRARPSTKDVNGPTTAVPVEVTPKRAPDPQGRLVRLPPPKDNQRPDTARYTSEFDHKVEQETRARKVDPEADPAHEAQKTKTNAAATAAQEKPTDVPELGARAGRSYLSSSMQLRAPSLLLASAPSTATFEVPTQAPRAADVEAEDATDERPDEESKPGEGGRGFLDTEGARRGKDNLSLGSDDEGAESGGAPVDMIEEGTEGTGVYLNALQRRYASFFNRLTDAVRRQWKPEYVLRQRSQREMEAQPNKRFTMLEIVLDRQGRVVGVRTDRYSGADYLDDEAARAVRAAGPFGSPPPALFEGADRFSFRFGFTIHFQRGIQPAWPWGNRRR